MSVTIDTGIADCCNRMRSGPGRYVAAKICIIPAIASSPPMTANG